MAPYPATLGVILAGGLARRMGGGDKPLLTLGGQTLLASLEERLGPQCEGLVLNANDDPLRFAETGLPVVPDSVPGRPGPLAGVLAALEWTAVHRPFVEWVISVPGDTPFIPEDLVSRLHAEREAARQPLACAASGSHEHYAICLWPVALRQDLRHALTLEGVRRMEDWSRKRGLATATWATEPFDPFFNINTPEELIAAQSIVERGSLPVRATDTPAGRIAMTELDLSGLKCPLPVLRTRKALLSLGPGDRLSVTCTDPLAGIDVPNLVRELGDTLLEQRQDGTSITFVIAKVGPTT
ncbi:molybdenum cofactor guanylyltransferase MobA [Microvirga sp. TS319]|uniref:molybdenum cofactor guanylyltransferase MobA n=1 Tax=Microvirga sp. TS319 TaxID=3241165 RepID=UPI00351AB0A3